MSDAEEQVSSAIKRIRMLLGPLDKPEVDIFTMVKMIRDRHLALLEYYAAAGVYYKVQFNSSSYEQRIDAVNRLEAARRALEGK